MSESQQLTKEELMDVAKYQANYCWLVLAVFIFRGGVIAVVGMSVQVQPIVADIILALNIVLLIVSALFMYRLTTALKLNNVWLYIVALFIPFVNLMVIFYLITLASKVLRANNVRVGLMGAHKQDLEKL